MPDANMQVTHPTATRGRTKAATANTAQDANTHTSTQNSESKPELNHQPDQETSDKQQSD